MIKRANAVKLGCLIIIFVSQCSIIMWFPNYIYVPFQY